MVGGGQKVQDRNWKCLCREGGSCLLVCEEVMDAGRIRKNRRLISAADARDQMSLFLARRRYIPRLGISSPCSRLSALLASQSLLLAFGFPLLASSCLPPLVSSYSLLPASFSFPPAGPSSWLLSLLSLERSLHRISLSIPFVRSSSGDCSDVSIPYASRMRRPTPRSRSR